MTSFHVQHVETLLKRKVNDIVFCFTFMMYLCNLNGSVWFLSLFCILWLESIHILRHHIFGIFGPPSPLGQHVFSTKNKQKLAFSDPPSPPTSADVIYEWSLIQSIHFYPLFKHLDEAWDMFWIKSLCGNFKALQKK